MSFIFIIIINLFKFIETDNLIICERSSPFLKNGTCMEYCSKEDLKSGNCLIVEQTVKIQYLSNLIIFGSKNYRYININSNKNWDLVILTTKFTGTGERLFYGLKENGRFLFKNNNFEEYPYLIFNISEEETKDQQKFESESYFIQISNSDNSIDENEYYLSMAKADQYTEMFDFENGNNNFIRTRLFFKEEIYSDRWSIFRLNKENNYNYNYLFAAINKENEQKYKLYLKKIYFSSKILSDFDEAEENTDVECKENKMVSCFQTDNGNIVCFYRTEYKENKELTYYTITSYKCCFSNENSFQIAESISNLSFYKCLHLKGEIGFFIYFLEEELGLPHAIFKYIDSDGSIKDYNLNGILNLDFILKFRADYMLNDIVKFSNSTIFYAGTTQYKDTLYYINFTLLNSKKVNMKYYGQSIAKQNRYKIFKEVRLSLYKNQFITVGTSLCPHTFYCFGDNDEHYASFFIYSYPNSTDVNFSLTKKLYESNEEITDISFNLENYSIIENNLFGYVVKGIKIINFPDNIKLISTKTNSEINRGDILSENENFTISFPNNNYITNNYKIEYALVATEDKWSNAFSLMIILDKTNGDEEEDKSTYGGGTYIGRTSIFNIIIDYELGTDCLDDCSLCSLNNKSHCITCKDEYHFEGDEKICKGNNKSITYLSNLYLTDKITEFNSPFNTTLISFHSSSPNTYFSSFLKSNYLSSQLNSTNLIISSSIKSIPISFNNSSITSFISNYNSYYSNISSVNPTFILTNSSFLFNHTSSLRIPSSYLSTSSYSVLSSLSNFQKSSFISRFSSTNIATNISTIFSKSYSSIISNIISTNDCSKEKILENKCKEGKLTNKQIEDIYNDLKNDIINKEYNKENKIIETQNAVFQLSLSEKQKYQIKPNISSIDLGECEKIIKANTKGLKEDDELIILKTDIRDNNIKSTFVQFEIFHPYTLEKINISICENYDININVPVYLDESTQKMTQLLNESGYNIFDERDRFYNDICSKFTTDYGADIILRDRRNDIYTLINTKFCQKGCKFQYYNFKLNQAKCNCRFAEKTNFVSDFNDIKTLFESTKSIYDIFSKSLSFSNILVMECYKLVFSFSDILHNYGFFIMTILFLFFIICMLKYFIKDKEKVNYYFNTILNQNYFITHSRNIGKSKYKKIKGKRQKKILNDEKIKKTKVKSNIIIHKKKHKHNDNIKNVPPKKYKENKFLKHKKTKLRDNENQSSQKVLKAKSLIINNLFFRKNSNNEMNSSRAKVKLKNKNLIKKKTLNNSLMKKNSILLNDYEINNLNYKDALILDHRTYFQYYFSLLKSKHIILFAFIPNNDYNLVSLKISLFIQSLSGYFTINALFFTDDTMHNIYSNYGEYIIFNQIPKILYSAFISLTIQKILKLLCISEYDILKIKKEKKLVIAKKKSQDSAKCLYIKFLIFFILCFCLMIFFWYFITCFCAVYSNTQIILIKNVLLSYGISMIYPIIINLIPGFFRISALKAKNKDKEFIYKISSFVALI